VLRARRNGVRRIIESLKLELLIFQLVIFLRNQKVYVAVDQFAVQRFRIEDEESKYDAWMAPRLSVNDSGDDAPAQIGIGPDPYFPRRRIGKNLDILHAPT
jgi:hypothetical protein